ncbi:MAG: hypothetical protein PHQ27_10225, partial [Victivallales bacterium]|nr:hypothetical protein [Victivallales bacterium]
SESEAAVIDPSEGPAIVFRFSPDGASSGGPVVLKLAGHAVEISASPLTGTVAMREIELEDYAQKYKLNYEP